MNCWSWWDSIILLVILLLDFFWPDIHNIKALEETFLFVQKEQSS